MVVVERAGAGRVLTRGFGAMFDGTRTIPLCGDGVVEICVDLGVGSPARGTSLFGVDWAPADGVIRTTPLVVVSPLATTRT